MRQTDEELISIANTAPHVQARANAAAALAARDVHPYSLLSEYSAASSSRRTEILIELLPHATRGVLDRVELEASREMPGVLWEWSEEAVRKNIPELEPSLDRFFARGEEFKQKYWTWNNDDPDEWNLAREAAALRFDRWKETYERSRRERRAILLITPWLETHADGELADFTALHDILLSSDAESRRMAWECVAMTFRRRGLRHLANQCLLEALRQDPSSAATAWRNLAFEADHEVPADLLQRLRRFPRPSAQDDRAATERLVSKLRRTIGPPGSKR